jgi:hypothetical protein
MKTYVKKMDLVHCIKWTGNNLKEVEEFCTNLEGECRCLTQNNQLSIMHPLVKGYVNKVEVSNYIVKRGNQTFEIHSEDEFSRIYQEFKSSPIIKEKEKARVESNILKIGLALPIKFTTHDTSNNNLIISDSMGVVYTFKKDGSYEGYVVTKKGTTR